MKTVSDWGYIKDRFSAWWNGELTETPLLSIIVRRDEPTETLEPPGVYKDPEDKYLNIEGLLADFRNNLRNSSYEADAFPSFTTNFGPGSIALYLGSEPEFAWDTVWFKEVVEESWQNYPLKYNPDNKWWLLHHKLIKQAQDASNGDFCIDIPDLVENIDILAAMRGPQATCYDLIDEPEIIAERIKNLDDIYFKYYDTMYDIVKDENGGSSFTAFHIWGPGKTAKVQCDFAAMMSPSQFSDFIVPSIEKQCKKLTNSLFHLDGKDAIKHVPALMEATSLKALQWTPGAGQPDGGDECWYPIYDQARTAGKSIWVYVSGSANEIVEKTRKLVKRYGVNALYILAGSTDKEAAAEIMKAYAGGFK